MAVSIQNLVLSDPDMEIQALDQCMTEFQKVSERKGGGSSVTFQTITFVNRKALETVVHALACTEHPHIVRELMVTRNLPVAEGEPLNPINQLIQDARNAPAKPD